ncbi:MAG: hypothetical protein KDA53_12615 [Hyphomonas sp.]|nr:hypothetical protein [Hyphomonas sp.]
MPRPKTHLVFDLQAFRARAQRVAKARSIELTTLSKKLFRNARTLPGIMDPAVPDSEKTFPRFDTLLDADRKLKALETGAEVA